MLSALAFEQAAYGSAHVNVVGAHHSQMAPIGLTDTLPLRWQFRRPWVDSLRLPARETLENPGHLRDNGVVVAGQDWGDGRQAARFLGLRAHHRQEADQTREVSL
jgi:hypothetical protein